MHFLRKLGILPGQKRHNTDILTIVCQNLRFGPPGVMLKMIKSQKKLKKLGKNVKNGAFLEGGPKKSVSLPLATPVSSIAMLEILF